MSTIRVCEVVKTLNVGGVEVLLVERLRRAPMDNKEYTVVCLRATTGELIERLTVHGVTVVNLERRPRVLAYAMLARVLRRMRPDIVNVHSPMPAVALRLLLRFIRPRPFLVSTVHYVHRPTSMMLDSLATAATTLLDRLTRRFDDLTVAVSALVARSLTAGGARRIVTRIHGVDVAEQRHWAARAAEIRREFGIAEGRLLVACVANFRPQKNHHLLLRVAERVVRQRPDVVFALAGDGPLRAEITRETERLGLGEHVRILGRVSRANRLVAAADLLVLSSHYEGLPVVVMEALAAGVPVVSTAVGGVPELVRSGANGILTEPESTEALAAALLEAANPGTRERLRRGALASSRAVDMDGTAEWFDGLYEDLAATGRRTDSRN